MPIPASALFVVSWVLMFENYSFFHDYVLVLSIFTLVAGILMVSNVRYPSFKKVDFKKAHFVKTLFALIVLLSLIFLFPIEMCTISTLFLLYGMVRYLYTIITKRSARPKI